MMMLLLLLLDIHVLDWGGKRDWVVVIYSCASSRTIYPRGTRGLCAVLPFDPGLGGWIRSAPYNWPAKIEHWPTDFQSSNISENTAVFCTMPRFTSNKTVGIGRPMLNFDLPTVK